MNKPASPRSGRSGSAVHSQPGALLVRFARRVRDIVAECVQAQRRLAELTTAPDRYLMSPNVAPDTYEEFLFRTSGLMRHEPPAYARAAR
jgi:hypothetical protein